MTVTVLRTTGETETHEVAGKSLEAVKSLISARYVDVVNLRDGRVMLVDDAGYAFDLVNTRDAQGQLHVEHQARRALKPVNEQATGLYWSICKPGVTHQIVGDVAIVLDKDFA